MTKGSGDARTQPLYFLITTAGTDTHSICYEQHEKAEDILAGKKIDPTFYPVIYGADRGDDWTDEDVWHKANPSLGVTVPIEKVRQACTSAKQNLAEENAFRQLRLNQWVKQSVRWMPMRVWNQNDAPIDLSDLEGRVCYGGLDLASTTDITAFVLVFPPYGDDDKYTVAPWFWIPEDNLKLRVARDHVPYDLWQSQGFLQTTEGKLAYAGHAVLSWMVDNIHVRTDPAGNIKPDKQKSAEKIDGVVATIMAIDRAIRRGNAHTGTSVFDSRGLLVL